MLHQSVSNKKNSGRYNHANYQYLTTPEKHKATSQNGMKQQQLDHFKAEIEKATKERGIEVDYELHSDLIQIINDSNVSIT